MSEIETLLRRAKDSVRAARGILRDGFPDFAASRAYYAMFYVAEALLAYLGESYRSHAAVIAAFGRLFAKTGKIDATFHQWLIAAQNLRNIADYGVEAHVTAEQAHTACDWAEEFIRVAEKWLGQEA